MDLPPLVRRAARLVRRPATALMRVPGVRHAFWTAMRVPFDPFDLAFRADPYPHYRRLRERGSVHYTRFGCWLVTGYAEALAALREPRFGHPDYGAGLAADRPPTRQQVFQSRALIARNPPDHTRLRGAVTELLTSAGVEAARPSIQAKTDRLLDRVEPLGRMDVIEDLAYPLTMSSIAELIGIPDADLDGLRPLITSVVDGMTEFAPARALTERAAAATERLGEYFDALIVERRRAPRHDLVSGLAASARDGRLDADELLAVCFLLFSAGYVTTIGLIGNGMLALLQHPDELRRLREQPGLIRTAVEECLRYDAPVHSVGRIAFEDVTLAGHVIRRGQQVLVLPGAANRDPAQFLDPDRFDVARKENLHVGFGAGIHACLGQSLARAEGQIAIASLVRRFPRLALGPEPLQRFPGLVGRGLRSLPVVF